MRQGKVYVAVVCALSVMIAIMTGIIIGRRRTDVGAIQDLPPASGIEAPAGSPEPEHIKLRKASAGKVSEITHETRLMGNGDETVEAVHFRSGVAYIFGNATVKGLDYDSYGGFLCVVNAAGTILSFTYFDGRVSAVAAVGDAYYVGAGTALYRVDTMGEATRVEELGGTAADVFCAGDDTLVVITQPASNKLTLIEYGIGPGLTRGHSSGIIDGYTLEYLDCYVLGTRYVIAARAVYPSQYAALVFYTLEAGGSATERRYGGSGDAMLNVYDIMPHGTGYIAAASTAGRTAIIEINGDFTGYRSTDTDIAADARLLYSAGRYFVTLDTGNAVTYELDESLARTRIAAADGAYVAGICNGVFMGTAQGGLRIFDTEGKAMELDIAGARVAGACVSASGMTLVLTATGGSALSAPTWGRDVYVISVAF